MEFNTYEEARAHHEVKEGVFCVHIIDHPESYEWVSANEVIIKYVGVGRCKRPGYPICNQSFQNQESFINLCQREFSVPVFRTKLNGKVHFMGRYSLKSYQKLPSLEGFHYFEFTLLRFSHRYRELMLHICI